MIRRLVYILILILSAIFLLHHLNDGRKLLELIRTVKWEFVVAAAVLQILYFFLNATLYQKAFELYDVKWSLTDTVSLILASFFVNLLAPLGALTGAGVFLHKAKKEKVPSF